MTETAGIADRVTAGTPAIRHAVLESAATVARILSDPGQAARVGDLLERMEPTAIGRAASAAAVAGLPDAIGRKPLEQSEAHDYVVACAWQSAIYAAVAGATAAAVGVEDASADRDEVLGAVVETVVRQKAGKRFKRAAPGIDAKTITRCVKSGLDAGVEAAGTTVHDIDKFVDAARAAGGEAIAIHEDARVGVGADAVSRAALDAYVGKL